MKKLIALVLSILMVASLAILPAFAADDDGMIVEVNFATLAQIANQTFANGAKSSLTLGNNWLPPESALVQDDGVQVLHYIRTNDGLGGFDVNTIGNLTGDSVVYSMTFKYTKIEDSALFTIAMVNGSSWYYSLGIYNGGKVKVDFANVAGAKAGEGTEIGTLSANEYHTVSVVYDLTNGAQRYYLDGELKADINTWKAAAGAPTDVTRFKMETVAMEGDVEMYIKNFKVYNATVPHEAAAVDSAIIECVSTLESYVTLTDYRADDQTAITAVINEYKPKIQAATTAEAAYAFLSEAKGKIDEIPTDAERTATETLDAAKAEGKTLLQALVKMSDYSTENQAAIQAIIDQALTDIDLQADETALNKVVTIAKNKILAVKTLAEENPVTEEQTTTAPEENSTAAPADTTEESGCSSSVGVGLFAILASLGCAVTVLRKKED